MRRHAITDPIDGLPIVEVGEWAVEKHERIAKYIDIAHAVRRKFVANSPSYIDLFCGPGRCRLRETNEIIDGSPLVAHKAAVSSRVPFSEIHLGDIDQSFCNAAMERIARAGGKPFGYVGPAAEIAKQVVSALNPYGLHFAFLDPYDLKTLSFSIIKDLSHLRYVDFLVHVSVQDLQRNSDRYSAGELSAFDTFAPNWRSAVDVQQSLLGLRRAILEYWLGMVHELGFHNRGVELVSGSRNQRLYWLMFLSRNEIANDFWDKIRNISGQRELRV